MVKVKSYLSKAKSFLRFVNSHRKLSTVVIVILLVIGYFILPKSPKPILTEAASIKNIIKTVSVTGKIDSENSVNLTFQSGGKLSYVGVKEGDIIERGQVIASLDKTSLNASLRQAQQDFTAAKAASERYYDNHNNDTETSDEKVSRTALDAAQNKAYDQMAKVQQDLNNSTLYSPIDGVLTRADAKSAGVNVTPATTFTVTDPNSLVFKMEVDEADIGQIKTGQTGTISLDAFPDETLKIVVDKVDFVSHQTSSGGNAFFVQAKISENKNFRIGMNGNAEITVDSKNDVLSIPSSSIFDDTFVYVKINQRFEKRKVTLGIQSDFEAEVKSGLSKGETVALDPSSVPQNKVLKK